MPFTKGMQRPPGAGKKPGSHNKLTLLAVTRLEELGCDPIEGMAKLAVDPTSSPELRGKMYSELAQYAYPKRKAIDHTMSGGLDVNYTNGTELLLSRIAGIAARSETGSGDTEPDE